MHAPACVLFTLSLIMFTVVWKASFWRRLLGLGDVNGKKYKTKDGKDPANAAQIRSPKTTSERSFRDDPAAAEKALASCNYILGVNALVHALQAERGARWVDHRSTNLIAQHVTLRDSNDGGHSR